MPANTGKGYPYPLGTDRVTDGDDAIHNLATAIDTKLGTIACGVVTLAVPSGASDAIQAITFPAGKFTATPTVITGSSTTIVGWMLCCSYSPTVNGCNIRVAHRDGTPAGSATSIGVSWLAIQNP